MYISDNAVPIIVGKNIQRCRILRGWSQTQLANEAEMDRADISRYENGSREMKITALYRVADALQVDMDQLFFTPDECCEKNALPSKAQRLNAQGYIEDTQYIERKTLIEQQLDEKRVQLSRTSISRNVELTLKSTRQIERILASDPPLTYFDEKIFTEMVKKVSVSNTAIEFEIINGMKLSEERTEK